MQDFQRKAQAVTEIQSMVASLEIGQDAREVCPYCDGGSTRERSLSIRRGHDMFGSYNCFRASCDLGGGRVMLVMDEKGQAVFHSKSKHVKTVKDQNNFRLQTFELWKSLARMLCKKYGLSDELLVYGNVRCLLDGRVAFTIFSPKRHRRGYVVRKYKDHYRGRADYSTVPKAINHFHQKKEIGISWYYKERSKKKQSDTLFIVEDIVSALRLCQWVDACAILGTVLEPKRQKEVKQQGYKNVVLALDADANRRSAAIKRQTENYLPNLKVKFLHKDIKDMTDDEIHEVLKESAG